MSYVYPYICLTRKGNTTIIEAPFFREWMWSSGLRALDVRLSEWCCSASMVWVQIPSREEQKFDSSKI